MGVHADLTQEWERQKWQTSKAGRNIFNDTLQISPLLLDRGWSPINKLVGLSAFSSYGIIFNSYFVASFFVDENLQIKGYSYLICSGLADLMVSVVVAIGGVLQLAGEWATVDLCRSLYFIIQMSTYAFSTFIALAGLEIYAQHRSYDRHRTAFMKPVKTITGIVIFICFLLAYFDVYFGLGYDYCKRKSYGSYEYRISTLTIFHIIPFCIGFIATLRGYYQIESDAKLRVLYRRSYQYERDRSLALSIIAVNLLYVIFWVPHVYLSNQTSDYVSNTAYYYTAWLGISRAVLSSTVFCIMDSNFRRAYVNTLCYCCCRSTLNGLRANRNRRAPENNPEVVAVHILTKAMKVSTPQRAASSSQETQAL